MGVKPPSGGGPPPPPPPPPPPGPGGGPPPPPPPPGFGFKGPPGPPPPPFGGPMFKPPDVLPHGLKPKKKWEVEGTTKRLNWKTVSFSVSSSCRIRMLECVSVCGDC